MINKLKRNPNSLFFQKRGQVEKEFSPCLFLWIPSPTGSRAIVMLFIFMPSEQAWKVFWLNYLNYSTCSEPYAGIKCKNQN